MKIDLNSFIYSISVALDYAEAEIIRTARYHGRRVAALSNHMAAKAGFEPEKLFILTQAAMLHDCALHEYLTDEFKNDARILFEKNMGSHCIAGERILGKLPAYRCVEGTVLWHHERADGKGPFGKLAAETPLAAQILHLADMVDVAFSLEEIDPGKYERLTKWLEGEKGKAFSGEVCSLFQETADYDFLCSISGDGSDGVIRSMLPEYMVDVSTEMLREMSSVFAEITDYKSNFTWRHSAGIAEKAEKMGHFYGYDSAMCDKLFIAGALHDVGKLLISNEILEKPGRLTDSEYAEIQNHAMGTWEMLKNIRGLEDICRWAALHHEKLDGSGYPFGYFADELSRMDRLMACLDIYQALVEERPYKSGLSHEDAMNILRKMGEDGQLDQEILGEIDSCFAAGEKPPAPPAFPAAEEKAPTSSLESREDVTCEGEAWRCPVCGYVYEGSLPDNLICPRCEQPGSVFRRIQ